MLRTQEASPIPGIHDDEICRISLNTINKVELTQEVKRFAVYGALVHSPCCMYEVHSTGCLRVESLPLSTDSNEK